MPKKLYFPKRIAEPKQMEKEEMTAFEKLAQTNYQRWVLPLVMDASEYLPKGPAKILDVGCGPGLVSKGFAEHNKKWEVTGVDTSKHALVMAKKNCRTLTNTDFIKGSVYKLGFRNGQFNLVVCKDSLHHFDNPASALKEMFRVLGQGGTLYVQDLRRDLPNYLLKRAIPADNPVKKLQFFSARAAYTKPEIINILKSIKIHNYKIATQHLTKALRNKLAKLNLLSGPLKEGCQARYLLTITKK